MNIKNKLIYYRDASWERDPDAFQELYEQYEHCDSDKCECPKGRDYGANKGYVFTALKPNIYYWTGIHLLQYLA